MTTTPEKRLAIKKILVDHLSTTQYKFFITLSLYGPRDFDLLKQKIRQWSNQINRYFSGRRAGSINRTGTKMSGLVAFEKGPNRNSPHAHLMVNPPAGASDAEFRLIASAMWSEQHRPPVIPGLRRRLISVTTNGTYHLSLIESTDEDNRRVIDYCLKEQEFNDDAFENFDFL